MGVIGPVAIGVFDIGAYLDSKGSGGIEPLLVWLAAVVVAVLIGGLGVPMLGGHNWPWMIYGLAGLLVATMAPSDDHADYLKLFLFTAGTAWLSAALLGCLTWMPHRHKKA